jgi:hypothetical protein
MNRQVGGVILLLLGLVAIIGGLRGTWWRAWRALVEPDPVERPQGGPYPAPTAPGTPGSGTPTG